MKIDRAVCQLQHRSFNDPVLTIILGTISGADVDTDQSEERNRRAIEACQQTRADAVRLLACIDNEGETYFDRSDDAPDVDVTSENAAIFRCVIDRMDVALAALKNCG